MQRSSSTRMIVWNFGLIWAPSYASYTDFWYNRGVRPCTLCGNRHSQAVQSYAAFCPNHEVHAAIITAWSPHSATISVWYDRATMSDKMILAKLLIPRSLFDWLALSLGRRRAYRAVTDYQSKVLKAVEHVLPLHRRPPRAGMSGTLPTGSAFTPLHDHYSELCLIPIDLQEFPPTPFATTLAK
eukprot:TRINITY_DN13510_c0_g4_i1.p1 TRINITY_DN13510_c0_g4~~TRINITY_DN13510_c0_g4_i1.p1  ORF type:complete len:184 (+),score=9.03 TRINITY_DN13510_c0_g4_i1:178-729(+)